VLQLLLLLANDSVPPSQTMEVDASKLAGAISVRNPFNSAHTTVAAAHVTAKKHKSKHDSKQDTNHETKNMRMQYCSCGYCHNS
jgi:hypothetical protein